MTSRELVAKTIRGENNTGITPITGWLFMDLEKQITEAFGSLANFEDKYEFDMAHIFEGPFPFQKEQMEQIESIKREGREVTPDILLEMSMPDVDNEESYELCKKSIAHHKARDRFLYAQAPGIFELFNYPFGMENHLCNLLLYPDELHELYARQVKWTQKYAQNMIDLGVDMVHISDDWGSQRSLMFSPETFYQMIYPYHKDIVSSIKAHGAFASLHSDGCIIPALDGIVDIGYDVIHPWQETAGMSYSLYLEKYADKFAILGGICVQSTLGFGNYDKLTSEIHRVFSLLKNKRWLCNTTHFVADTCSMEELTYAFDLIYRLAGKGSNNATI